VSVGHYLRTEITGPLDADFFVGLPAAAEPRVARLLPDPPPPPGQATMWTLITRNPDPLARRAFLNPPPLPGALNSRAFRAAEIPAANGVGTARALARIYGALAMAEVPGGARLLEPETLARATTEEAYGPDAILPYTTCFGLGFMLSRPRPDADRGIGIDPFGPSPRAFGHPGRGGALAFADPDARVGFAYTMNQLVSGTRQHRRSGSAANGGAVRALGVDA
jgi:CubicO group peptidase (beta-lactamase class C family)